MSPVSIDLQAPGGQGVHYDLQNTLERKKQEKSDVQKQLDGKDLDDGARREVKQRIEELKKEIHDMETRLQQTFVSVGTNVEVVHVANVAGSFDLSSAKEQVVQNVDGEEGAKRRG